MIIMVLLEGFILFSIFHWFHEQAAWIDGTLRFLSVIIVLAIIKNSKHLSKDMFWIIDIILFPIPGTALYLLLSANLLTSKTFLNIYSNTEKAKTYYQQDEEIMNEINASSGEVIGQCRYISHTAGFPFYRNTGFDYYPLGDSGYPIMLEELKKAEKFIFLEYFIIEEGKMWNGILEILEETAKQGLNVRVLYDDFGSFLTRSARYAKKLEEKGIKCIPFNRINPIIGIIMNHRDHRKSLSSTGRQLFPAESISPMNTSTQKPDSVTGRIMSFALKTQLSGHLQSCF